MGFSYTFTWPASQPAEEVYVTGSFDNWSKSAPLVKNVDGSWSASLPLPSDEKITYKFVVDNNWVVDYNAPIETDEHGNTNNVIHLKDIAAASTTLPGGFIPESAIPMSAPIAASEPKSVAKDVVDESAAPPTTVPGTFAEPEPEAELATPTTTAIDPTPASTSEPVEAPAPGPTPTVMPKAANIHEPFLGTPGIVIPANANEIAAFREISTVDARTLNEPKKSESAPTSTAPEYPQEPEPTPAETSTQVQDPQPTISGITAPPSAIASTSEPIELPQPSIKSNGSETLSKDEAIGAFYATPGIVLPPNLAEIKELQQPLKTEAPTSTVEEQPVVVPSEVPTSADTTVSDIADTSTSTSPPEVVKAEDVPATTESHPAKHVKSPTHSKRSSFLEKVLDGQFQRYPYYLVALVVVACSVRYMSSA